MDDRSLGRDVHFYDASNPDEPLGGLISNPSISVKNFLSMLEILIVAAHPYSVSLRETGESLMPTEDVLQPGHYDIHRGGTILITDEPCITRIYSDAVSGDEHFRSEVRARDGKCVITGTVNTRAYRGLWQGWDAVHVFPLGSEDQFLREGLSQAIRNKVDDTTDIGINSCQNGLLTLSSVHQMFDDYEFSINPDDDYKIIFFDEDPLGLGGGKLDPICRDPGNEQSVRDDLLRWHFRQAVLVNMRGVGEPSFEIDFPPGSDMVGEILSGPQPAKRMEAELFSRLNETSRANCH
ncbi:hypothetical protein V1504DRAFT_452379 [Lipomyces starkeyi]